MGDMAYVLRSFSPLRAQLILVTRRSFGGGFEMLEAGQDKDGLWKVIDDYMASVHPSRSDALTTH